LPIHINKGKSIAQTLMLRTDYAIDPDKTDGGRLVTSYGCDHRTADVEFLLSKREYLYQTGRDQGDKNILAYHVRQSFKPGEITPEEALDAGYELAMRWTRGKHAFIVAVHVDKEHVHSAIVYNSTTLDCTRKFRNFKNSSFALRRLSDIICAERGLSVIKEPKQSKGRSYGKWLGDEKPMPFKETIRQKIDEILPGCDTFEAFLAALRQAGYEVGDKRKHITVKAPGQTKPWRLNTLEGDYTEQAIRERIAGTRTVSSGSAGGGREAAKDNTKQRAIADSKTDFSLLIDIQEKLRQGKGEVYRSWATTFNLKEAAKTLIFLQESGVGSYTDLEKKAAETSAAFAKQSEKISAADKRLADISELQKHISNYSQTRDIYKAYRDAGYSKKFRAEHEETILLHQAAKRHFDKLALAKLPTINTLKQEYAKLLAEKKSLYSGYREAKENMRRYATAKLNADSILGTPKVRTGEVKSRRQDHEI
jgi:hypothetical protein